MAGSMLHPNKEEIANLTQRWRMEIAERLNRTGQDFTPELLAQVVGEHIAQLQGEAPEVLKAAGYTPEEIAAMMARRDA